VGVTVLHYVTLSESLAGGNNHTLSQATPSLASDPLSRFDLI